VHHTPPPSYKHTLATLPRRYVYNNHNVARDAETPLWILAMGGAGLVVGLATYGYNIIRVRVDRANTLKHLLLLPTRTATFNVPLPSLQHHTHTTRRCWVCRWPR
jgi:hypothetical protein